jgi:predicted P-loop ATPase
MRNAFFVLSVLILGFGAASAKDEMQGTLVSENSVQCGAQTKGKKSTDLMCQEYVIRTATTEYHVRQEKEGHKEMLPVNAPVELTISKDKMKFKVNGKSYEMLIVSEAAAPTGTPAAAPATATAPK